MLECDRRVWLETAEQYVMDLLGPTTHASPIRLLQPLWLLPFQSLLLCITLPGYAPSRLGWQGIKSSQSSLQPRSRGSWWINTAASLVFREAALGSVLYSLQACPARSLFSRSTWPLAWDHTFYSLFSYPVLLLPSSSPDPIISISWDHLLNNPFVNESLS